MSGAITDETFEAVVKAVKARRNGQSYICFCPGHDDKIKRSLALWREEDGSLGLKCYSGCRKTEVIDAIERLGVEGLTKSDASDLHKDDQNTRSKVKGAQLIWDSSNQRIEGTPVEAYLKGRGIHKWPSGVIGFWSEKGPTPEQDELALANPIVDYQGRLQGVQRLYLTRSGAKANVDPSRRINGLRRGGGTILPGTDPTVLCEGLETGLAIWLSTGYQVVCTLGLANLDKLPLGSGMAVVVARDLDKPGSKPDKQLWRAVRALRQRGVTVRIALPDKYDDLKKSDFNDVLVKAPTGEARVKELIDQAQEIDEDDPLAQLIHQDLLDPIEAVKDLNHKYLVVKDSGKTIVIEERRDEQLDRDVLVRLSFTDFRNYHMNQLVNLGNNRNPVPLGEHWLESPRRRQYGHIVFQPKGQDPSDYNLWRGWAVEPEPGEWGLLEDHILNIICSGNEQVFEYLIRWLARGVQELDSPGQVAVVFRGKRGTGKGTLANAYGKLFGQHFLPVSQARHITGNFNSHLRDCLLLFADEAFWAGDKQGESVLKTLVTESTITIEAKGRDVVSDRNRVKLMVASNSRWVVPAGMEERRFLVLDVAEDKIQDRAYFQKILSQLENGGYAGFLHDLLNFDISDFDVFNVPQTEALLDQKLASMQPHEKWWFECLMTGQVCQEQAHWQDPVSPDQLHQAYLDWCKKLSIYRPMASTDLIRWLQLVVPELTRKKLNHSRNWGYQLDSLTACRQGLEGLMKQKIDWVQDAGPDLDEDHDIPF